MVFDPFFPAWLAGFIDGEGCFHISRWMKPRRTGEYFPFYMPQLVITNTVRGVLEEIAGTLGAGCVRDMRPKIALADRQPVYQYVVASAPALEVTGLVLPYLRVKRAQAEVFLQWPAMPSFPYRALTPRPDAVAARDAALAERERLRVAMQALNLRGQAAMDYAALLT